MNKLKVYMSPEESLNDRSVAHLICGDLKEVVLAAVNENPDLVRRLNHSYPPLIPRIWLDKEVSDDPVDRAT